ncbi:MAG: ABC transporter substrate-binding protein [Flavobacteriaceae bacterium]
MACLPSIKLIFRYLSLVLGLGFLFQCKDPSHAFTDADVFRYNEYRNVTSLDPAFARNPQNIWPVNQLFNGLVQLDSTLQTQPEIASHWNISEDGLTYTFQLRSDVFFHPSPIFGEKRTRKVIADDFVYSLQRLTDPKLASPGGWVMQHVAHIKALDSHRLRIQLKKPFPAFLGLLSMRYCSVVPKEVVKKLGSRFRSQPIGTGPFQFQFWEEDVKLILRKNTRYFETDATGHSLPYLESVAIQFIPDIQSEFMLFLQGKLDFLNSLDSSYKDELLTPEGELQSKYQKRIQMQLGPYLNTEYIGIYMDSENPAIRSRAVREALAIGFDRKKMVYFLRNNIGFAADKGFIPFGLPGYSPTIRSPYDPQRARQLIHAFTKKNGRPPELRLATDANYLDVCQYIQREVDKLGIQMHIDLMPTASLRQAKSSGKLELFRASWIADYPDAENYLGLYYSQNFSPQGPNYTHYSNPQYDSWFEKAYTLKESHKREVLYRKMDSLILADYPVIPLYYDKAIRFVQKGITGLPMNPINTLSLKTVKKE